MQPGEVCEVRILLHPIEALGCLGDLGVTVSLLPEVPSDGGKETPGPARRVDNQLTRLRIDSPDQEVSRGPRREELTAPGSGLRAREHLVGVADRVARSVE